MDMTTGLDYSEDYSDPEADVWVYNAAANPLPKPKDYRGPRSYYEYLQTVAKEGEHGAAFGYKTINTDALGWILAKTTGRDLATLLSERIWRRIGAEQDAYMTVDSTGTPFAGGGLSAGLRDLGRVGQLVLDGGVLNGERVFPAEVVENIRNGGDKAAFAKAGYKALAGGSYRSMWWVFHNRHGAFAARGVHGQTIYIDPTAQMVIVRFASHPQAKNSHIDPTSLPAYQAVAEYLMDKITVRGVLRHFPQDVKSVEAWLGHEFTVDGTPVRPTQAVPAGELRKLVGKRVTVEGTWNAGEEWKPEPGEQLLQTPEFREGQPVIVGSGVEATAVTED
jgi:CubicO group peptidase (beta-lactamase class C family)